MKKWVSFLLIFILALVLIGCGDDDKKPDDGNNAPAPRNIIISGEKDDLDVGETLQLTAKVEPEKADQEVVWSSKDDSIATVSDKGLVTAVGEGTVIIVATSKKSNRVSKEYEIRVSKPFEYADPTSVEIVARSTEVRRGSSIQLSAVVHPNLEDNKADQTVIWESSDENIATVDTSGRVQGKAIGEATVTVKVVANMEITAEITVFVVEGSVGPVEKDPTSIVIQGETSVEEGYKIALVASVLPSGVSQNVIWSTTTPDLVDVQSGIVTARKAGTAYIIAQSAVDTSIEAVWVVSVKPQVPEDPDPDMGGYELLIMAAPHAVHEHDPFLEKYEGKDKLAKQSAWEEIETRYNVKLKVVPYPESAPWGPQRINWLIEKATLGQAENDIFVSTTDWLQQLAEGNAIVDVSQHYVKYGKNSMNPGVRQASTYKGGLYAMPTHEVGSIRPYHGLFYNVNLVNQLGLESPAKLFNEGRWTFSGFEQYVRNASSILGADQTVLSGKPAGLYYGMASASGVKIVDTIEMKTNFNHPYVIQAAYLLRDLYISNDNVWGSNAWDAENPTFNEGKSIFQVAEYWFVKTPNRFREDLWGEGTTHYGYVPFPYPDEMKKEDTRVSYQGGAVYMMSAGRQYPSGVTEAMVYRAFTNLMLWTQRNMHADPELNEDVIMRRAAEAKLDDPESVTAIAFYKSDKVIFDPFYSIVPSYLAGGAGGIGDAVIVRGEDYQEVIAKYEGEFLKKLNELYG